MKFPASDALRIKRLGLKVAEQVAAIFCRGYARENYDSIGGIDATSVIETANGKDDFRFSSFAFFLSPVPRSAFVPSRKKFERVESMKGAENKGTTIVEGTKTSSLKSQRLASPGEK